MPDGLRTSGLGNHDPGGEPHPLPIHRIHVTPAGSACKGVGYRERRGSCLPPEIEAEAVAVNNRKNIDQRKGKLK